MLVRRLQAGELDLVAPVWESLLAHHAAVAPDMPTRPPDESWRMRRADYERWLAEPDAFALVAEEGGAAVGYAVVRLGGPDETWVTGERTAELETLAVIPSSPRAGRGLGADGRRRRGAPAGSASTTCGSSVVAGNDGAMRFYERRGPGDLHEPDAPG